MSTEIFTNTEIPRDVEISDLSVEIMGDMFGSEVVSESIGVYQGVVNAVEQLGHSVNVRSLEFMESILGGKNVTAVMEAIRNIDANKLFTNFGIGLLSGAALGLLISSLGWKTLRDNGTSKQDVALASTYAITILGFLGGVTGAAFTLVGKGQ